MTETEFEAIELLGQILEAPEDALFNFLQCDCILLQSEVDDWIIRAKRVCAVS